MKHSEHRIGSIKGKNIFGQAKIELFCFPEDSFEKFPFERKNIFQPWWLQKRKRFSIVTLSWFGSPRSSNLVEWTPWLWNFPSLITFCRSFNDKFDACKFINVVSFPEVEKNFRATFLLHSLDVDSVDCLPLIESFASSCVLYLVFCVHFCILLQLSRSQSIWGHKYVRRCS